MSKDYKNEMIHFSSSLNVEPIIPDDTENDDGKEKPDTDNKSTNETIDEEDLE